MAIKPADLFLSTRINAGDADYPQGSAFNDTTVGAGDGTYFLAEVYNDFWGFFQRLLIRGDVTPSGVPDTVLVSDYHQALNVVIQSYINNTKGETDPTKVTTALLPETGVISFKDGVVNGWERRTSYRHDGVVFSVGPGVAPGNASVLSRWAEFTLAGRTWGLVGDNKVFSAIPMELTGLGPQTTIYNATIEYKGTIGGVTRDAIAPIRLLLDRTDTHLKIVSMDFLRGSTSESILTVDFKLFLHYSPLYLTPI